MRAEGGRILPPKNSPTKAHDSHFLTRTCHQHPAPTLSPTPWSAPPCGSFIVKVKWSRSAPGSTFQFWLLCAAGFSRPRGWRGVSFGWGRFTLPGFPLLSYWPRKRAAQGVAHWKGSVQPEQTLLILNAHREQTSKTGLTSSRFRPRNSATRPDGRSVEPGNPPAPGSQLSPAGVCTLGAQAHALGVGLCAPSQ